MKLQHLESRTDEFQVCGIYSRTLYIFAPCAVCMQLACTLAQYISLNASNTMHIVYIFFNLQDPRSLGFDSNLTSVEALNSFHTIACYPT